MASAWILITFPAALFGTLMMMLVWGTGRVSTGAIGVAVALTCIAFIGIVRLMKREHPSRGRRDASDMEDRAESPDDEKVEGDEDDEDGDFEDRETPVLWSEEDGAATARDLGRLSDDGAPPAAR